MKAHVYKSQRGIALLMCIFAIMLVSAIGLGLMYMSDTETNIDSNFRDSQRTYYASKAGLEEARDRIRAGTITLPTTMPTATAGTGVTYIINPDNVATVQPWTTGNAYFDDELCHEFPSLIGLTYGTAPNLNVPCTTSYGTNYYTLASPQTDDPNTGTAAAMAYKWVRINLKQGGSTAAYCVDGTANCASTAHQTRQVCANGTSEFLLPAGDVTCEQANAKNVYMITSLGVTPSGTRRMTQQEIAQVQFMFPSALTLDGSPIPPGNIGTPHSNNFRIQGASGNSCGEANPPTVPAIGTMNNTDATTVAGQLFRPDHYTGSGPAPDVENVSSSLGALSTVGGLNALVNYVKSIATQTYNSSNPTITNWGTTSSPEVIVVNGDLSGASGSGILLVTGTLTMSGNTSWDGIVLVIGQGNFQGNGGGNGHYNGAILVARTLDSSNNPLPASATPGPPTWGFNGGGGNGFTYDSCWVNKYADKTVLKVMSSREEVY